MITSMFPDHQVIQLENGIREALLQQGEAKALVVLEGLFFLKYKPEKWLTFDQIYRLLRDNFGCSRRLVYEGLQSKLIFQRRKAPATAYQRGARPYLYRIPYPLQLQVEFAPEMSQTPRDQLNRSDLRSVTTYRMALHRELYVRKWLDNDGNGFKMYRDLQADRLGVSTRTIRTYDYKLGFSHEANLVEKKLSWGDWEKLPRFKEDFDMEGRRKPSRKWLKIVNWKASQVQIVPHVAYLAYVGLQADYDVYEVYRDANTYYPYQRPNPRDYDGGEWSLDFYFDQKFAQEQAGLFKRDNQWVYLRE